MDSEILKAAGVVIGLIVAAPLFYACLKAAALFGAIKTTVDSLADTVAHLSDTLSSFTGKVADDLSGKETRLQLVESRIEDIQERLPDRRRPE